MKPNGLVAAAATTSHTEIPSFRLMMANSLTSAMFTERKVFSKSFTISAVSGIDPLGREGEEKVLAGLDPARLEARQQDLLRRPGIGRRFQDDELAGPD